MTGSTSITSIFPSRYRKFTQWGRINHVRMGNTPSLIYRRIRAQYPPAPVAAKVIHHHNTIHQTVLHLHQVTHRHLYQQARITNLLRQDAFLVVLAQQQPRQDMMDPMRPTQSAQKIVHLFSMESAQRELRPFYSNVVRSVLLEEQERYKSRPSQAISLIWTLFGRQHAFRTLTRFYMGAVEKLGSNYYPALAGSNALYLAAGIVLHSRVYQRYMRQLWGQDSSAPLRYLPQEQSVTENMVRLTTTRRTTISKETLEQMVGPAREPHQPVAPEPVQDIRLSEAEFRSLVRGVANSLGRQARLETLRRGGE